MALFTDYLNFLSPVFSQDPAPYNAIQITSSGYVTVSNNVLTIYESSQETSYPLANYTLSSLVSTLTNNGISASLVAPVGSVSANTLLDTQGSSPITLQAFSSDNFVLFKSQAAMLDNALSAINENYTIINIRTCTGPWLDYWGWFLQVPRYDNEPDSLYAERIIGLRLGHNVNNVAIENFYARMGYTTTVIDGEAGTFAVNVKLPTQPANGFYYTVAQLSDALTSLKAAGIQGTIVLQGLLQDTIHVSDAISYNLPSATWKVGDSLTIGQFTV